MVLALTAALQWRKEISQCCVGDISIFWSYMEGVDTCEQQDQNLICLNSKEQTDHAAQGDNILYLWGKEIPITEVTLTKYSTLHPRSAERSDGMSALSPCRCTGASTGWTLLTLVPRCSGYSADTVATYTFPPAAAKWAILRCARLHAGAAVTVLPFPSVFTNTLSAVAHSMAYKQEIFIYNKRLSTKTHE